MFPLIFWWVGLFFHLFLFVDFIISKKILIDLKIENELKPNIYLKNTKKRNVSTLIFLFCSGVVFLFISLIIFIVFSFFLSEEFFEFFTNPIFYFILGIFCLIVVLDIIISFNNNEYKSIKYNLIHLRKLREIESLIIELENRKISFSGIDSKNKFRSKEICELEKEDIDRALDLLKKMYSYLEFNYVVKKVNKCFSFFKNINVEKGKYLEMEKEMDILNSKIVLNNDFDKCFKELKAKYS